MSWIFQVVLNRPPQIKCQGFVINCFIDLDTVWKHWQCIIYSPKKLVWNFWLSDDFARVVGLQFTREFLKGKFEFLFFSPTLFRIFHLFFCVEIFFLGLFFCLVFLRTSCIYILYTPPKERREKGRKKRWGVMCWYNPRRLSLTHTNTQTYTRKTHQHISFVSFLSLFSFSLFSS